MSKVRKFALLMWTLVLFVGYTNLLPPTLTPWPHVIGKWCGEVDGASVCRASFQWYFWLYTGFCLAYMWLVVRTRDFIRPTALLLLAGGLFSVVQPFTFRELSHLQTYSFEVFIVGFYSWMAWMVMLTAACFLWPRHRRPMLKGAFFLTVLMTLIFAFKGRSGVEHVNPLVGGLLVQQTWDMAKEGKLLWLVVGILAAVLAYTPFYNLIAWVVRGKADIAVWKRNGVLLAALLLLALMPLVSLPLGEWVNQQDIKAAKAYIDKLIPKIDAYYEAKKEYPDTLQRMGIDVSDAPRLLDVYDYLAYNTKGGFFLSRPEKYCFIFPNPTKTMGYWSRTSVRQWRFKQPSDTLEESFESVCDETNNDVHQALIAGHLGIADENDPLTALGVESGAPMPMQRQTQAVTPQLQQAIDELGYKVPEIYKQAEPLPEGVEIDPQRLLEELKKQPLRTD